MTARVFWRSFLEPMRSVGTGIGLSVAAVVLWISAITFVMVNAGSFLEASFTYYQLTDRMGIFMFAAGVILAFPIISGEARDRTLLLNLLLPISRARYYTARVLGRACFAVAYFAVAAGGMLLVLSLYQSMAFAGLEVSLPPDVVARLGVYALSMATFVLSMAALAPISSSRFGHIIYWLGLVAAAGQARGLAAEPHRSGWFEEALAFAGTEILGPLLTGPGAGFLREAALGDWYLWRALLQWGFGAALAYSIGVAAFSRMEVGLRQ